MSGSLFGQDESSPLSTAPLAERMRPVTLDDVIGQQHLLGPGKPLRTNQTLPETALTPPLGLAFADTWLNAISWRLPSRSAAIVFPQTPKTAAAPPTIARHRPGHKTIELLSVND